MATSRELYVTARNSAKARGIEFHFSFEEWIGWWEQQIGPDWQTKRGCKKGQFVMARYKDKGPYVPWNVKCITTSANVSESHHHTAKLTKDQVLAIRQSPDHRLELAERFGVNWSTIYRIQTGKIWK